VEFKRPIGTTGSATAKLKIASAYPVNGSMRRCAKHSFEHVLHAVMAVASRMIVLNFGELIAEGAPRAVMDDPEVQRVYMGIDV
jgi:ABC-type uncharacterized transport system ATPase subunit